MRISERGFLQSINNSYELMSGCLCPVEQQLLVVIDDIVEQQLLVVIVGMLNNSYELISIC